MQLISDGMRLRMLRAVGATCLSVRGQSFTALFVSENQVVDFGGPAIESHAPLLICRTSDARKIGVRKDDEVDGLPEPFRVKSDDGGDRSAINSGQWAGFHTIELKR